MSGMIGVFSQNDQEDIHPFLYQGIMSLQHRGQKGFGYVVNEQAQYGNDLLADAMLRSYKGHVGIAFVKYAFTKEKQNEPMLPKRVNDSFMTYDGSISYFKDSLDDLVKLHHKMLKHQGAFAFIVVAKDRLIAMRDPWGIKPLVMGRLDDIWIVASETCALESINANEIRDVNPGEMVIIDKFGCTFYQNVYTVMTPCLFEYIYIARPDSTMNGVSIYEARKNMGKQLFKEAPVDADVVIGAPDSGLIAALGYAQAAGIPYEKGIVKNKYIGRTFIEPDPRIRKNNVDVKLAAIPSVVKDKEIILVEDSIVRGTTIQKTIKILKNHGAKKVHVRVSSPPIIFEENTSIDIPNKKDLMSYGKTVEEVRDIIGCDSLYFLSLEGLKKAIGNEHFYTQYFDGESPFKGDENDI
ncbi:MAG TPA: amidophosphoribosyltransferase [Erysipelothrix sp.]|nr:amidophosphoribosyltransferase [Erysipelothrix sp.]